MKAESMSDIAALLMRAITAELAARIDPELTSADARERARFARLVLDELAADLDILPPVAGRVVPELRAALEQALAAMPPGPLGAEADPLRRELAAIAGASGSGSAREVLELRLLGGRIMRHLADCSRTGSAALTEADRRALEAALQRLGAIDARWLTGYDEAKHRPADNPGAAAASDGGQQAAPAAEPARESVTAYLRRRFARDPALEATAVVPIPGGRSKKTYFISLRGTSVLPAEIVMRQDYALRYEGTKVRDEYRPLSRLAELQLPVPKPLLLESEPSELGPPFILVERLAGSAPGSYFGLQTPCPGAFRDLARLLAKLHATDANDLGFAAPPRSMEQLIDDYERKWRDNATQPSPVIDYAYAWARAQCARELGRLAPVHGDCGPYNMLVADDRMSALLDWEFARVGDPAEDLGIARIYVEGVMSWPEFLQIYSDAGGSAVSERRVQLGMLLQFLKGTTLVAASGRNFAEGWTREFIKGANAFTGLRLIELRIAKLLERFGAV